MKILLVSYYPLPYTGGVWTFVSLLKKSLEDLGHSVDVLSHTPDTTKYRIIGKEPEIEIDDISPYIKEKIVTEMPSLPIN
ncbi:glycosyltransferase family 1 protein, partial [Bacillus subtilis]|nr:glycosyltransferase family 1 protein [Bacillus subtilis]